jgi:osmotically-inducible protein OsmY
MGFGRRYLDNLQQRVRADLDARELSQVDVAVEQQPTLRRIIVLSGEVSARDRMTALEISQHVAGVAGVRWSAANRGASAQLPSVSADFR